MTKSRPSPVTYEIRIGIAVLNAVLSGDECPICKRPSGDHARGCLVGEAIINSPLVAARARAAREKRSNG